MCSSTWVATTFAAALGTELGHRRGDDSGGAAAGRLGHEALRTERHEMGPGPVNAVVTNCRRRRPGWSP